MSESDARKQRARILYIANPDNHSDEEITRPNHDYSTSQQHTHNAYIPPLTNVGHSQYSPAHSVPNHVHPLVTNLPPETASKGPNHPALSSPSSTSSPAAESTPPPSTPGLPGANADFLNGDHSSIQEPTIVQADKETLPTSTSRKIYYTLTSPFRSHNQRPSLGTTQRRPATSPTVSTPDSYSSTSSLGSSITVAERVIIVVTADADRYFTVDISGAKDPAFIKERIFNKLSVWEEEDQKQFSIWLTEIGAFAIGDALSDERLFELCRERGDSKGSLKFFVSYSSALVHEPVNTPALPQSSNPIPPPVLPSYNDTAPLRPAKRRSRSRQGSLSSTSDPRIDVANGYEADLDNPDRDSHRTTIRPPPHQSSAPQSTPTNPPSPLSTRRPNCGNAPRALSPLPRPPSPQDRRRPSAADISPPLGDKHNYASPVPPPLSPNQPTFLHDDQTLAVPSRRLHARSGSDAAAEREQAIQAAEDYQNAHQRRPNLMMSKSRPDLRNRMKRQPTDIDDKSSDWVHVDPVTLTNRDQPRSSPSLSSRQSPVRYKASSPYGPRTGLTISGLTIPNPPRNPPPAVPQNNEPRPPAPGRSSGRSAAHSQWPMTTYGNEERGEQKAMITSSTQWHRMLKGTKSMDSLKAHPTNLQPGRRANASRFGAAAASRDIPGYGNPAPGLPKSYETRHTNRQLPVQGPSHSSSFDFSQNHYVNRTPPLHSAGLMVSSNDPYPRPQSAIGEHPNSPSNRYQGRQMQSPTYTNNLDQIPQDILRSPRAISPIRSYPSAGGYGSRPSTSDRSIDAYSTPENHRTPPRSPTSPRSPRYPTSRDKLFGLDAPASESNTLVNDEDHRATLTADSQRLFAQYMNANASESTLLPGRPRNDADVPTSPLPPITPSDVSKQSPPTPHHQIPSDEYDSDPDDRGTLWAKPPMADDRPKSILRGPALKVQIENANGSVYPVSVPSTGSESSRSNVLSAPQKTPSALPSRSVSPRGDGGRGSTFIDMRDYTWAPRPPPEDVYERLEEFFPEHDLDKPVIEASSGGTSPTAPEYPPVPPLQVNVQDRGRVRSKKSIRIVAEEHKKRIDRTSRAADTSIHTSMSRKRSTKLWGSRLEEVTTMHAAKASLGSNLPESPPGGPTTFKWVRGELIGRGTYGRVYLALNATTGEMMAVKQVEIPQTPSDKNDSRQVTVVQALKLESETLKDLDHPNIVQYLGFEETPSNLSIFLEYVPGGSIGSCLLKHGKFDEEVTKSFTGQILDGLEYLHSKGILHRDLKADNILVEKSGICKISDFGISKRTDDMGGGAMTAMQGTVFWMAPEVINTQKKGYNFKIDIWSVGCVVLEMWAGKRPWVGDEAVAVMFKLYQAKLPPPVPEDVVLSPLADDFRRKCFAINPEERPTASELRRHKYLVLPDGWVFNGFI